MSLYCSVCGNNVPEGRNQCGVCNNGFVSQLACGVCLRLVTRGNARCSDCPGSAGVEGYSPSDNDESSSRSTERRRYENRRTELVRRGGETSLDAGRFGAISDVTVPDNEAALMGELGRGVQVLLNLANTLSRSSGHTEISRKVIRECRTLATLIQEELETRRGP
jgi:hypothetical protein